MRKRLVQEKEEDVEQTKMLCDLPCRSPGASKVRKFEFRRSEQCHLGKAVVSAGFVGFKESLRAAMHVWATFDDRVAVSLVAAPLSW